MNALRNIFFVCVLFFSVKVTAQYYDLGQDPSSVKWNIIKTEHFKIIFPLEIQNYAQHIARSLELVYEPLSSDMKIKPVKIPVVLHDRAILSNAEVPWAPKRIEFYMCPSQDDYAQPWADQLVLHEFRHVVQYSKINQGFTKVLSYFFGQQITAGVIGAFVPLWFVEGDAVCTETALSQSGRGRIPDFEMGLRAQIMEKSLYNYNKAVFGSYKTYVPDRYTLGYNFVASARKHYTKAIWEQAMDKTAKLPFMIVPFNSGIKKVSKLNKVQLYKLCFRELDSLWKMQDALTQTTDRTILSTKKNNLYCSYYNGNFIGKNTYMAVKSGINDITHFISIDSSGNEHRIFTPGSYFSSSLSISGNTIYWSEASYDPRWDNRSYSVIIAYDFLKHKTRQLTHRTRYFAPSVNNKGDKIVCVEQSVDGKSYIAILDSKNGTLTSHFAADSGDFLMMPDWSDNDKEIVFIALNKDGKRICIIDSSNNIISLNNPGFTEINQAHKFRNFVYYAGAYSGISNIYVLNVQTNKTFQITSSKYGASDPVISQDGTELLYSDYTADGYKLVKTPLDSTKWISLQNINDNSVKLYESLSKNKTAILDFNTAGQKDYNVKRYLKFLNLFNFHSWGPLSINADNTTIKPGFEILSQNVLSTMFISAGYEHEWLKPQSEIYATLSYRGWYPHIDLQFSYKFNKSDTVLWDVMTFQAGTKIPLKLTKGKNNILAQPQINFILYDLIPRKNFPAKAFSGSFLAMEYRILAYNMYKTSLRDIYPRWGQMLDFIYRHTPFGGTQLGNITALQGQLFFPGIGRHHSLSFYGGYQQNIGKDYIFSDIISYPHGYDSSGYKRALSLKSEYQMPLFYPDWSLGSVFYIKRFRASLYYDIAFAIDKANNYCSFSSAGIAIVADFHFLRFLAPLSMGIRTTYRFDNGAILPEFVYSVNFDQLRFKPRLSRLDY